VLSAYVQPVVADYLRSLERVLRAQGVRAPLYAMRSNGGVSSFERAAGSPIALLESGPVGGVTAAAELGRRLRARHILTLDIGGTTAKTAAIRDGEVRVDTLHHIGRTPVSAGYPVQAPTVEIVEIGAGGGSIVWADGAGGMHVGPRSAGADPGPACYGRGGQQPTLTDANLVAGRLDPDYFLGGTMRLDPGRARQALSGLAATLGADVQEAARGVLRYAIAQMSHALRLVTVRRGYDPRDFAFVAYGGAGPLHAALLARELGIARTIIPPGPGHFSAFGMLAGPLRADAVQTVVGPLDDTDLDAAFARAQDAAIGELGARGAELARYAELRYQGQEHTLELAIPAGTDLSGAAGRAELRSAFDLRCLEAYAFRLDVPLEVVAVRVSVVAPMPAVQWSGGDGDEAAGTPQAAGAADPAGSSRLVDLDIHGGVARVPVIGRSELTGVRRLAGPCVVEEQAATTLVLPGQAAYCDEMGNLVIAEGA
jgi:N-methylhydantoinase A